jgi:tetratricopeptide (TPR) repeat protein
MIPLRFTARRATLALLLAAAAAFARVDAPVDLDAATAAFREGAAAYERGDFAAASKAYARAEAQGAADARLEYNHGNALFRQNRLGEAILHYERARKLAPTDADVAHNLAFARSRTVDKVPEPQADPLTRALWTAHSSYSPRAGAWLALGLWMVGFLALSLSLFVSGAARLGARVGGGACFALLLLFAPSLAYKLHRQEHSARAVVLQPVADLRSGPGEGYERLFEAHEGTPFTIVERHGEWLSVKLPDGRGGFIRKNAVGEV